MSAALDPRLDSFVDDDLRDLPKDPKGLQQYLAEITGPLADEKDPRKKVLGLGEKAVHLRRLAGWEKTQGLQLESENSLAAAERALQEALNLIKENDLSEPFEIQQKIRLAHVWQWQKRYKESTALFQSLIETCGKKPGLRQYLDFAWQHAGKNLFDQGLFSEATNAFRMALDLRTQREAPQDQIDSSKKAIEITRLKMTR